ncbi:MAG: GTP 3',8-cyclase MoaA [Thermoprotei archaeon]|nr:MAG: GTP 3',8-cyclase MoaA [Thermoprotei archaeon]
MLVDRYGRPVTHMRISVTNRCNHYCIFCHNEGIPRGSCGEELSWRDWGFVAEVAVSLGIKYYKLTGGEPLLRSDIASIVRAIREAGGSVSIVTNGSFLERRASELADAGVERVNVSLHSLNPERFARITSGDLGRVLSGIEFALNYGIPLKIDYVVLAWNLDEYRDIIGYAEEKGVDLNVIELIPLGMSVSEWRRLHVSLDPIVEYLEEKSSAKYIKEFQSRPTYRLPSGIEVTVVRGFCNPELCMKCTRLRLTPDGFIKTCIYRVADAINARKHIVERDYEAFKNDIARAVSLREPFFKPGAKYSVEELYGKLR